MYLNVADIYDLQDMYMPKLDGRSRFLEVKRHWAWALGRAKGSLQLQLPPLNFLSVGHENTETIGLGQVRIPNRCALIAQIFSNKIASGVREILLVTVTEKPIDEELRRLRASGAFENRTGLGPAHIIIHIHCLKPSAGERSECRASCRIRLGQQPTWCICAACPFNILACQTLNERPPVFMDNQLEQIQNCIVIVRQRQGQL